MLYAYPVYLCQGNQSRNLVGMIPEKALFCKDCGLLVGIGIMSEKVDKQGTSVGIHE